MTDLPSVGELVNTQRTDRKLSQKDLAVQLGVTQATINRWEMEKAVPDPPYEPLLEFLGLDLPTFALHLALSKMRQHEQSHGARR